MTRPHITDDERRKRLGVRHRLDPAHRAATVEEAAASVVCLHGTDQSSIHQAVFARADVTAADVDAALHERRTLVKHMAMRRTVWAVPRDLLPAVHAASSTRVAASERTGLLRLLGRSGVIDDPERWLPGAMAEVLAYVAEHPDTTSAAVREAIPSLRPRVPHSQGTHYAGSFSLAPLLLTLLECEGRVVRSRNAVGWHVSRPLWSTTEAWLGAPLPDVEPRAALAEVVRGYLARFGPATVEDVQWWLGHTKTAVRTALADVGAVEVDLSDGTGWVLEDDLAPTDAAGWVALLPPLDPTTMGWKGRAFHLPAAHVPLLFDTAGNGGPTCWWDGRVVGGWRQDDAGAVELQLLEDVPAGVRRRLANEAERLTALFDGRRVMLRFPSPLWREGQPRA